MKETGKKIPEGLTLSQNFPNPFNPFNPSTSITFGLTAGGYARLCVYDMHGRTVSRLVNGRQGCTPSSSTAQFSPAAPTITGSRREGAC